MKHFSFILLSLVFFSPFAAADDKQPVKYAILVGVDDYTRLAKLQYAKNDIEALRDQLLKIGFERENVHCLTCGGKSKDLPTKDNITVVVKAVADLAEPGDIIVLAMNGHGVEVNGQARFCPMETKDDDLEGTTVAISEIFDEFQQSKATFKLMLVDACRNNPFLGRNAAGARSLQTLDDPPKGIVLLQSCAKDEISYEDPQLKRGVFTHYLVEGLAGKAVNAEKQVTLLSLASYATNQTKRHVLNEFRANQRPYLKGEITDFVLVSTPPGVYFPDDYKDLQTAIDNTPERGTLFIKPGTHRVSKTLMLDKNITIASESGKPEDTAIEANESGVFVISAESAKIEGLMLRVKCSDLVYSTIQIDEGKSTLKNCHITNNKNWGVWTKREAFPVLLNCRIFDSGSHGIASDGPVTIEDCKILNAGGAGIYMYVGGLVENVEIWGCKEYGILIYGTESNPTIRNCKIHAGEGRGISFSGGHGTVEKCEIYGNGGRGIYVGSQGNPTVKNCVIKNNKNTGICIYLGQGTFENNTISGNKGGAWSISEPSGPVIRKGNTPNE